MQNKQSCPPEPHFLLGSNIEHSPSGFQISANTRNKLEKLARWRIESSAIKFIKGGLEFHGGYGTVSRAFLAPPPDSEEKMRKFDDRRGEVGDPSGGNFGFDGRLSNSEEDDECGEVGIDNGKAIEKSKESVEDQEQGSEAGTSGASKAVAVKKMKIADNLERVLGLAIREAEFLVELAHENIIALEGFVEDTREDIIWLVFPWGDNGNLRDFVASADWEIPERIGLIRDVASGVQYLHSREPPICHGDLKSVNILVNVTCRAVVTDFGSARRMPATDSNQEQERTENALQGTSSLDPTFCDSTNTITLTGGHYTLRWAAPELLQDDQSSLQSDIWALGWVAYEVMTNSIPFQDVKDAMVIKRVVQGDLPSIMLEH
ncbi:hypothetical protein M407DRAFT_18447 [Tulasnella calospora MUT 4182]|uniref:Protein kinase domain-containing protein n=1 Tax=Tulasnella calospora MUT 4182 TaxID=1051891 RepID=A0A0C3MG38_9AGAM|nr:hypothetical protein M407DRAFT_18447 [Tulasnella calospora MUT 4182]